VNRLESKVNRLKYVKEGQNHGIFPEYIVTLCGPFLERKRFKRFKRFEELGKR